jgi:alpha-D-xyloside xylohydrolase
MLPEFAAGFWQCKLRYSSQEELLEIAREYKRRGLPLSVIVVDYFHWTTMGHWDFDPPMWPDPAGMVRDLDAMGIKLMVSIWPTVNRNSRNYDMMKERGLLARSEQGDPLHINKVADNDSPSVLAPIALYDATHPEARKFLWQQVREGYYRHGIKVWWLDACEPELRPTYFNKVHYHLGSGTAIGRIYPLFHAQCFWEGMRSEGETDIITLCRSAWVGSQRYGAAVWSGDIPSTFEGLRAQVPAGLNIGLSGIPWWTTDIGGFEGGDPESPYFRELIVRWFQFAVFCPLFRLHGVRQPVTADYEFEDAIEVEEAFALIRTSGGPNEVWSFGEEAYTIIREQLKPYILEQMQIASTTGLPPMRPLFVDFPADSLAWDVEDQFMFGPDLLIAPVLWEGARTREVYLPGGSKWIDAWTGQAHAGGHTLEVQVPLDRVPVFWWKDSEHSFLLG